MTAPRRRGSWTIPALIAGCVLFGAPRASAAGPPAPRGTLFQLAQADTASGPGDEEDEEEVPIPPNLRDNTPPPGFPGSKDTAPDTTGAGAARQDSTRLSLPAEPETLRYVQPGGPGTVARPGQAVGPTPPKPRSALFGLGPVVIILGLAVIHFLVLRTVGG